MRCVRCGGPSEIARGRTSNGHWQYFHGCPRCRKRVGTESIPHAKAKNPESLPIYFDRDGESMGDCDHCGVRAYVSHHHYAPTALFGDEAESWPTEMLCEKCHLRWHWIVTPQYHAPQQVKDILANLPPGTPAVKAIEAWAARKRRGDAA